MVALTAEHVDAICLSRLTIRVLFIYRMRFMGNNSVSSRLRHPTATSRARLKMHPSFERHTLVQLGNVALTVLKAAKSSLFPVFANTLVFFSDAVGFAAKASVSAGGAATLRCLAYSLCHAHLTGFDRTSHPYSSPLSPMRA